MLFHLTTEHDIRIHEPGPAETDAGGRTLAREPEFQQAGLQMADEAAGRDLEPLAESTIRGSVYGSPDRECVDLANYSAANKTRSCDQAKEIFRYAANFARRVSRGCTIDRAAGYSAAWLSASSWRFRKDHELRAFHRHAHTGIRKRQPKTGHRIRVEWCRNSL